MAGSGLLFLYVIALLRARRSIILKIGIRTIGLVTERRSGGCPTRAEGLLPMSATLSGTEGLDVVVQADVVVPLLVGEFVPDGGQRLDLESGHELPHLFLV